MLADAGSVFTGLQECPQMSCVSERKKRVFVHEPVEMCPDLTYGLLTQMHRLHDVVCISNAVSGQFSALLHSSDGSLSSGPTINT